MKKVIVLCIFLNLIIFIKGLAKDDIVGKGNREILKLYKEIKLEEKINYKTFYFALKGFKKIKKKNNSIITIVDFTKPSLKERGYVIDLKNKKILFSTYVMHGKNSGDNITNKFSNTLNSYKMCIRDST